MHARKLRLAWVALGVFSASAVVADSASIECTFSPHLSCREGAVVIWDDNRFDDSTPIAMDDKHIYISQNNTASGFDLNSGETRWVSHTQNDARYFYPILSQQDIYLARTDGILEKHLAESGDLVWSGKIGDGWVYPPVIIQDKVITAGQDRTIWILDATSGEIQNEIALSQELVTPLFSIANQYFASTFDGVVSAYSLDSAQPSWQTRISSAAFSLSKYTDKLMISADMGGNLSAINVATGAVVWRTKIHSNAQYWSVLHQQKLYNLTNTGTLNILDANSGQLQGSLAFAKQFAQAPIVQGDSIALFDTEGSILRVSFDELKKSQNNPSITFN